MGYIYDNTLTTVTLQKQIGEYDNEQSDSEYHLRTDRR